MTTLDPISLATKGVVCGDGPDGISLATKGLICISATFQTVVSGIMTVAGALTAVFIEGTGATSAQKNGGTGIGIDIGTG